VEDEEDEEETWAAIEKKPLAAKRGSGWRPRRGINGQRCL
jgi:hypothetical protein